MKKIMIIFGTRPEVLKLYPIIEELKARKIQSCLVFTGQHHELAQDMIDTFKIKIDYSLNIMMPIQSLSTLSELLHKALNQVLVDEAPDLILVQGDTSTAFIGALEAYYHRIPVVHIEAGLRTEDLYQPFPEEGNRRMISQIAQYNFAPTEEAAENLRKNSVPGEIVVTGNTGIDTLLNVSKDIEVEQKNQVLVTLHRRESLGKPLQNILKGIRMFLDKCPDWNIVFPVHPNPLVKEVVHKILGKKHQVILREPVNYKTMVFLMKESAFILTDSGGIQEEAPSLNRPVLVAREKTERPEGIKSGVAIVVGTNTDTIATNMMELAKRDSLYNSMINKVNPYGDGHAAKKIISYLLYR